MITLKQYEARARQSMILSLLNRMRGITKQHGLNDYYRRLQELTTCDIIKAYNSINGREEYKNDY